MEEGEDIGRFISTLEVVLDRKAVPEDEKLDNLLEKITYTARQGVQDV